MVMKKTFKHNTIVHAPNAKIQDFLIKYAESKNVPIYKGCMGSWNTGYKNLNFCDGELCGNRAERFSNKNEYTWLTIEEFLEYCDNWESNIIIQLTDIYRAEIDIINKVVKVGCQTISFDKIKQVYEATLLS